MTTTFSITRDDREIPLKVIYSVLPEITDVCATDSDGVEWELTENELDELYEQECGAW